MMNINSLPFNMEKNMVLALLSPYNVVKNMISSLLPPNENMISPFRLPPNLQENMISLLPSSARSSLNDMTAQMLSIDRKIKINGSHSYPPFYATQNIIEAKAIKHLEVYTKKMRVQIEKGRKYPRRFEPNDLVQIRIPEVDHSECQYGKLNEYFSAIELVPVTGTFREYTEFAVISDTCVSTREAAI
ncbi:hypothetical protein F8M41_023011 [Gigaspora margarita]|uniref:Uncharacterized protein n=1 Tax=Gigaspora margarita TaxID=4874 RepID=A0A8H4AE35_GIGMA|nr:hypothetical protein F8M41_023011 [Gigaspora margarita]